ncbi:MAG: ATP-binding protein [Planctomycetes bacterium]|nr:ATP-binding protein [Planctomycetota bacterium]
MSELASGLLERRGVAPPVAYATPLALEEVLSNVIRHGYTDGGRHEIERALRVGEGGVEVEVVDDGREFDPVTAPEPDLDLPLAERRAGGLGIHLLRAFASEIRHERLGGRNILRLRIRPRPSGPGIPAGRTGRAARDGDRRARPRSRGCAPRSRHGWPRCSRGGAEEIGRPGLPPGFDHPTPAPGSVQEALSSSPDRDPD